VVPQNSRNLCDRDPSNSISPERFQNVPTVKEATETWATSLTEARMLGPSPSAFAIWNPGMQRRDFRGNRHASAQICQLVGQVESSVTFRATVRVRIKARFAGNGPSLGKKRNTESHSHSGSRRAAPQASWAVLQPLERACHSLRTAPCPQCLWRG